MTLNEIYKNLLNIVNVEAIETNVDMKRNTTFKIGGPADIVVQPKNIEEIQKIVQLLNKNKIPFFVMGNGSNLLVMDKGIRGVVIKLSKNFSEVKVNDEKITAQSGAILPVISNLAVNNNLTGFEFAAGIPGTIGGAITMNAGAHGGEMKDIVTKVTLMDYEGNIFELENEQMNFSYRKSILADKSYIVLSTEMKLRKGDKNSIKSKIQELREKRISTQPLGTPNAGSTFKRPLNNFAAKLIQDAGLKGYGIGGAIVSEKHSGFIVNNNNATASDVLELVEHIKTVVRDKYNITLEEEIKVVGE